MIEIDVEIKLLVITVVNSAVIFAQISPISQNYKFRLTKNSLKVFKEEKKSFY